MTLTETERDHLHKQLIQLGDLIAGDDEWGCQRREYNREYRKICKLLYLDMLSSTPRKKRKPNQSFIKTLLPCICGSTKFVMEVKPNTVSFACAICDTEGQRMPTKEEARDSWNKVIQDRK